MSQDGIFSILMGLAMIKRFIPANANVTTCEGAVFYPLQMAIDIAGAITDRVDNTYHDRIMWPGSDECCDKTVYLSNREGGRLLWAIHGVKKAYSYIDGAERHSRTSEYFHWSLLKTQTSTIDNTNEVFWLRLKTIGWDMGDDEKRSLYESTCITEGMEILPLMNNILHPDSDGSDIGINKEQFKAMLCAAPCGGPCKKKQDYSNDNPEWPTFECGNNPGWPGQCWERGRKATDASDANRQFNGLDFMILYNLYLLYFPEERTAYFHPDRPQGNISVGITGPDVLCDENMGHYTLLSPQPDAIQNLLWTTSSNLAIVGQPVLEADIKAGAPIYTPSFIRASFTEKSAIPQYFDGDIQGTTTVADFCEMTYYKPIISLVPGYSTTTQLNHCQGIYDFHAVSTSPDLAGTVYAWKIEIHPVTGPVTSEVLEGKDPHINQWQWLPEKSGYLIIKLKITTPCGETEASAFGVTYDCGPGGQLIVAPNPATNSDQVTVRISQEKDYLMNAKGVEVRFLRTGTGSVQKIERISQNGQSVSIAHFPPGNYTVQVVLEDRTVLTTTLVVSEK